MTQKPTWLNQEEYPFQSHSFPVAAGNMHYIDQGNGNPIVFVHGNPAWSYEYRKAIKHFSKTNRCIAPDHIGFGLSDKPTQWSYAPEKHAKNLELFLESLDLKNITLVVNDWGGPIGLSYAIKHPERIKNIVITNTWMWSVKNDWYYQAFSGFMGGFFGRWLIKNFNFFARVIVSMAFGDKSKLTKETHTHYKKPLSKRADRKGSWVFPKHIIKSSAWLESLWEQRELLQNKQVVIVWGMKDIAFREKELKTWETVFPQATVTRLETTGHFVAEESPNELINALEHMLAI